MNNIAGPAVGETNEDVMASTLFKMRWLCNPKEHRNIYPESHGGGGGCPPDRHRTQPLKAPPGCQGSGNQVYSLEAKPFQDPHNDARLLLIFKRRQTNTGRWLDIGWPWNWVREAGV